MPKITRNNFTKEDKVLLGVYFDANPYLTPSGKTVLEISFCINLFESIVIKISCKSYKNFQDMAQITITSLGIYVVLKN